ncbi:MAG: hypothetical protein R3C17_14560 [Planctomycetaceae bacterium]
MRLLARIARAADKFFADVHGRLYEPAGLDGSSDSKGQTRGHAEVGAPIFDRLGISAEIWCRLVKDFGKLFNVVAGQPQRIDEHRSKGSSRRYRMRHEARELMATV